MLGRLLCRLGVHDTHESGRNVDTVTGEVRSVWGWCIRPGCDLQWSLDNPVNPTSFRPPVIVSVAPDVDERVLDRLRRAARQAAR